MADNTPQPPVPNTPVSPAAPAPAVPASPAAPAPAAPAPTASAPTAPAAAVASTTPAPAVATPAASGEVVPVLSVQHFTKKYGSKVAVSDLSIDVMPGDIYGFIGHNGAGKTTLIKSVVGAQPFEGGVIFVDSKNVLVDPVGTKQIIAYVPDNPDIYEFMSGIKYLNYVCDIFGVPAENRVERITTMANRLGITDSLSNAIGSYSHGMKQKLVLISALLHEPKLIVLDEPFVGLDPAASFELKKMLHELADRGSAVFFSSHVLEVVEKLCNKIAIIRQGKLLAAGKTDEIRGNASLEEVFLGLEAGAPGVSAEIAQDMATTKDGATVQPVIPGAPVATAPAAPVAPTAPAAPVASAAPAAPATPVAPAAPAASAAPSAPATPEGSAGHAAPTAPGAPVSPGAPVPPSFPKEN